MIRVSRRLAFAAFAVLSLAACGQGNGDTPSTAKATGETAAADTGKDMIMGNADAPVTLLEYASWTCGACLQFHNDVIPMLKEEYVETGKVRWVFREFPTAPADVTVAGFVIARCTGEDAYFDTVGELFDRQGAIISLIRQGGAVKQALVQIGLNNGLADEAAVDACLQNETLLRTIGTAVQRGDAQGVEATPTVFINGRKLTGFEWRTPDGMRKVLDEALGETAESGESSSGD